MQKPTAYDVIREHYANNIQKYQSDLVNIVDWDEKTFKHRMDVLLSIISPPCSILDHGCGPGLLYDYLEEKGLLLLVDYVGYDLLPEMRDIIRNRHPSLVIPDSIEDIPNVDYVICNGTYCHKATVDPKEWYKIMVRDLDILWSKTNGGIAFDIMSPYFDYTKDRFMYLTADETVALAKRYTRKFNILHAYNLYEFTVQLFK